MPELPEVETYVRELEPLLVGREVRAAQVFWPRTIAAPAVAEFQARIVGEQFARFGPPVNAPQRQPSIAPCASTIESLAPTG